MPRDANTRAGSAAGHAVSAGRRRPPRPPRPAPPAGPARSARCESGAQVGGDHLGDRLGRGHLHALGDPGRAARPAHPGRCPGNASTLLIWLGKSLRPVATIAACRRGDVRVHLGRRVGEREDRRRRAPSRPAPTRRSARRTRRSARPRRAATSAMPPVSPAALVSAASSALVAGQVRPAVVAARPRVAHDHLARVDPARDQHLRHRDAGRARADSPRRAGRRACGRAAGRRCAARRARRSRCRAGRRGRPGSAARRRAGARSRSSAARRCPRG